ncbi:hypothetical protein BACI349Y_880005 [Bacillus sp. 349Y]|nr:hypothetical protein BACI349Y_880005 [Bacillus sp. 349Y]
MKFFLIDHPDKVLVAKEKKPYLFHYQHSSIGDAHL